jgi:SAM-dependent methyltransferase
MRSHELDLSQYSTEKIPLGYLCYYDPFLVQWVDKEITLLEIGVLKGGSIALWRDYFPQGTIVGIDYNLSRLRPEHDLGERVHLFQGDQADTDFLSRVALQTAADGFDIIIDDASHKAQPTRTSFWHLFDNHLKPGGLYAIEDWTTGYWNDWTDGKTVRPPSMAERFGTALSGLVHRKKQRLRSHDFGMVGFVKQLVDEQGAADVTRKNYSGKPQRESRFHSMTIVPSIVFIRKRG